MRTSITALIALDTGIDEDSVTEVLSDTKGVEIAAVLTGLEESWTALQATSTDIVVRWN